MIVYPVSFSGKHFSESVGGSIHFIDLVEMEIVWSLDLDISV
jgi:hypothetical protein